MQSLVSDVELNTPAVHILSTPLPYHFHSLEASTALLSSFNTPYSPTLDMQGSSFMLHLRGPALGIYRSGPIQLAPNPRATPLDFANFVLLARSDAYLPADELMRTAPYPFSTIMVGEYVIELYYCPKQLNASVTRMHATAASPAYQDAKFLRFARGVSQIGDHGMQVVAGVDVWRGRIYFEAIGSGDSDFGNLHICDFLQPDA